jgi:hypothetical protein
LSVASSWNEVAVTLGKADVPLNVATVPFGAVTFTVWEATKPVPVTISAWPVALCVGDAGVIPVTVAFATVLVDWLFVVLEPEDDVTAAVST